MKKIIFLFFLLSSCLNTETDILSSDKLTVEGQIEEGKFARISLTNSLAFRGIIDSVEVAKSIESKAKVVLSNGEISEILTLKKDESRFPFLYYRSNLIKGEIGKTYDLTIQLRGKEFISKTSVPKKSEILNIEFLDWVEDGIVYPDFKDIKLTIHNSDLEDKYFKILIKNEKEEKFELARPFIFSTENIATETFPLIVSYIKIDDDGENENQIKVNEVMEMQLISITKDQFYFWKSVEGDQTSILENASYANEVVTNISNGAFGYWSGENIKNLKFEIPE
ncbi:DUF4249 domain-containing protein [Polaribacter sp. Z014]|uniref:DUF4249 family protein n=1 Tax=Polaribacter sp. Z014 TaxID=2927126 RepID=UPI002021057C|nr:DUF4249 family protein [Polaribacter sp. Z014]MCL7765116.1 DUF4249 domain-containing protein [Polaribacter sp. Z014]